jgi:hypothetical protein
MKTTILILLFFAVNIFAQSNLPQNLVGTHTTFDFQKGLVTTTSPVLYNSNYKVEKPNVITQDHPDSSASAIRYNYPEPVSIGTYCMESGNGLNSVVGWYLNNERASDYGNTNSTPLWEFIENPQGTDYNYVAVSSTGNNVADAFHHNIYLLNGATGSVTWTLDLTTLPYTVTAGPVGITSTGNFMIGTAVGSSATDSSTIFGFNSSSNVPVWSLRIGPRGTTGSQFQGLKISGNDSLFIINTYIKFYVINTFTGVIRDTGVVNSSSSSGTQAPQAISGNGNIIATINYSGYVRVLQWNGSTYNLLWQHLEPPGTYYNWMTAVDVTNDGTMVACGTLNFITNSTYDGKVKLFSVSGGSTPLWTHTGMGDEVNAVSFSKNGRFLSACSWGDYYTHAAMNLLVFKTTHITNNPWYGVTDVGSFFCCSTSDDGRTVIGSGKGVHARQFGSGGNFYNLSIDTAENPLGINNNNNSLPTSYSLAQNYPNPFNPSTQITYDIPKDGLVNIAVYDVLGREVSTLVNKFEKTGRYSVTFDASNINSGVYFYKISAGGFTETKKMILIK